MGFSHCTVEEILRRTENEWLLPHTAHGFQWTEAEIISLLNSLMLGRPVGTILVLEGAADNVRCCTLFADVSPSSRFAERTTAKTKGAKASCILDGIQRLQALYTAMYGRYCGKALYFNIDSDPGSDSGYEFAFYPGRPDSGEWICVREFLEKTKDRASARRYVSSVGLAPSDMPVRIKWRRFDNAQELFSIFKYYKNICADVRTAEESDRTVDAVFSALGSDKRSLDTAKAEMRRLVFTTLWDRLDSVNEDWEFAPVRDKLVKLGYRNPENFITRCIIAMAKGVFQEKELDLNDEDMRLIIQNTRDIVTAVKDAVDFISSSPFGGAKKLPQTEPLLLMICWRYANPSLWNNAVSSDGILYKFLFSAYLCGAFDGKAPAEMMTRMVQHALRRGAFDMYGLDRICRIFGKKLGVNIEEDIFDKLKYNSHKNLIKLVLHIFYSGRAAYTERADFDVDHIFPQKKLKMMNVDEEDMHSILNCELIPHIDNIRKSAADPNVALAAMTRGTRVLHGIPEDSRLWELDKFYEFMAERRDLLRMRIFEQAANLMFVSIGDDKKQKHDAAFGIGKA